MEMFLGLTTLAAGRTGVLNLGPWTTHQQRRFAEHKILRRAKGRVEKICVTILSILIHRSRLPCNEAMQF